MMSSISSYTHTDLACESSVVHPNPEHGIEYRQWQEYNIPISLLQITSEEGERLSGRRIGNYCTISCGKIGMWDLQTRHHICAVTASHLLEWSEKLTKKPIRKNFRLLVAGLGNSAIIADALGPHTVDQLTVTRHMKSASQLIFDAMGYCELAAVKPGVLSQTGIESADLIRAAIHCVKPDLLLVIDALAARSCDRLASTIQLSDNGIFPGSGIGNHRNAITPQSMGIPVLSLGVPTVVDSSTLVFDALEKAGISEDEIDSTLKKILENGERFFVSLKESDTIVLEIAQLLSEAIETAYTVADDS